MSKYFLSQKPCDNSFMNQSRVRLTKGVILMVTFILCTIIHLSAQRTYTWVGGTSTAWNNTANWSQSPTGGTFPGNGAANDIVVIPAGTNQPTLNVTLANPIASLTFTSTNTTTLTISGVTLTVTGAVIVNSSATASRTITITGTGGTLSCASFKVGSDVTPTGDRTLTFTLTTATLDISNDLTLQTDYDSPGGGRQLNITFTHTSGTVNLGGTLTTTFVDASATATYTIGTGGATLNLENATPFSFGTGINTIDFVGTNARVDYQAASNLTIPATPTGLNSYTNLTIGGGSNVIKTFSANLSIAANLTIRAATTLAMGTFTLSGGLSSITMETLGGGNGAAITGSGAISLGGAITVNYTGTGTIINDASIDNPITLTGSRLVNVADDGTTTNTDFSLNGIISGATFGLTKQGAGTLYLSALNDFTGTVTIAAGRVIANTLTNASTSGSLGAGTAAISMAANTILRYEGSGHSSDRTFTLTGSNAMIDASGSGLLTLTGNLSSTNLAFILSGTGSGMCTGIIGLGTGALTKTETGSWKLSGANTYTGVTTISGGTLLAGAAVTVSAAGPFGNASSAIVLGNAATTTNNWSPTLLIDGAFTMARTITIANQTTSGTYTVGGNTDNNAIFSGAITFNQSFTVTQVATTSSNVLSITGGFTGALATSKVITFNNAGAVTQSGGVIAAGTGTTSVVKNNTGTFTLGIANSFTGGVTLNDGTLNINNAGAMGTVAGTFIINGGTIQNTTIDPVTTVDYPMIWNANFTFSGTQDLHLGNGSVTMNADIQITTHNSGISLTVGGTIDASSRSLTKIGAGDFRLNNQSLTIKNLTINAGAFVSTSGTMNIAGAFTNNAVFTNNSGTVIMSSANSSIVNNSTLLFNHLTINVTPAAQSQYNTSYSVAGTLTIAPGQTFAPTGGTITMSTAESSIAIGGFKTFYNLVITTTPTVQTQYTTSFSVAGILTINDAVTFAPIAGTITMSSVNSGISNAGTLTFINLTIAATPTAQSQYNTRYNVAGILTINGGITFAPTGGTIIMNSVTSAITNSGTTSFHHLTIAATPTNQSQYNTSFTVAGTFATSGAITYAPTGGTVTMSGSSGQISIPSGTIIFQNLIVSGSNVACTGNIEVAVTMTVNGVFNPSATTIISGAGTLSGSGTANVTRTAATPSFGAQYTIANKSLSGLTVNFNGAGAQTVDAQDYGNLTISTNGTRTVTFISGGVIRVSGVFTPTVATTTYVVTDNTFEFNGAGDQTITAFTYFHLVISVSGAKTVLAGTTVNCETLEAKDDAKLTLLDLSTLNVLKAMII
jgi:fibronectin-binding autotransporter adhesin